MHDTNAECFLLYLAVLAGGMEGLHCTIFLTSLSTLHYTNVCSALL